MEFAVFNDQVTVFLDALKLSAEMDQATFAVNKTLTESTVFPNIFKKYTPTIADAQFAGKVFSDFSDNGNNEQMWDRLSLQGHLISIGNGGADRGNTAYFYKCSLDKFDPIKADSPDKLQQMDLSAVMANPPVIKGKILESGKILHNTFPLLTTGVNFGTPPAGKKLYASLHVIGGAGTFNATMQSSPDAGFASPTIVFVFDPVTGKTQQYKSGSANLKAFYRLSIAATGSNWMFFCAAGYAK